MEQGRIKEILEKIKKVKIAVYGDYCLDAYWIMDPRGSEVSVETGLKAEAVAKHYYSPGGAGNVVSNLSALKPEYIKVIGVVGDDIYGRELRSQLDSLNADTKTLEIQKETFYTYTYLKKYFEGKEEPRADFGLFNQRSKEIDQKLRSSIENALETTDALIFNQQIPGSITNEEFIDDMNRLFNKFDEKIIVVDSRHFNNRFSNVYRKTNESEIAALCGVHTNPNDTFSSSRLEKFGKKVFNQSNKPVVITRGSRGVIVVDDTGIYQIPSIQINAKLDTVGAGDTYISAMTLCLAAGISPYEAAEFANFASAITVQKLFTTGTATGEEILGVSFDPDFVYNADLADNPRNAIFIPEMESELCDAVVPDRLGHIKHAVFDHDGTISTLREGWEEIMEPVMIKAILGEHFNTIDQAGYNQVVRQVQEYIDKTTGIQTIYQMEGLIDMIREFGYVPEDKILDKYEYKEIYNNALMEMVNKRLEKLRNGELDVSDFTLKGAIDFLKGMKERGVSMYLASGTDVDDVINEARVLGYAGLFNGGIYGAMRDITRFSKKMVIEKIILDNKLKGNELAVFGDGPVEMRECRRFDGIAIGIASNEIRRYGMNPEKRSRVIKAGAQILISDFSQHQKLTKLLFKE